MVIRVQCTKTCIYLRGKKLRAIVLESLCQHDHSALTHNPQHCTAGLQQCARMHAHARDRSHQVSIEVYVCRTIYRSTMLVLWCHCHHRFSASAMLPAACWLGAKWAVGGC